jgi:hypothetical protein
MPTPSDPLSSHTHVTAPDSSQEPEDTEASTPRGWNRRRLIAAILAALLLASMFYGFGRVFSIKDAGGVSQVQDLAALPNDSIDCLVLGSSHAYRDINPAILYQDYGVTAYDLGSNEQYSWTSYEYLQVALRTQKPKVVLLDVFSFCRDIDYATTYDQSTNRKTAIQNTYGLSGTDFVNAAQASYAPEDFSDYFITINQEHNKYTSLNKGDFLGEPTLSDDTKEALGNYQSSLGFYAMPRTNKQEPTASELNYTDTSVTPITAKNQEYLIKIIDLCKQAGVQLDLVCTPNGRNGMDQSGYLNYIAQLAGQYGVPFYNYNKDFSETGLNLKTDYADDDHLNFSATAKFTRFLYSDILAQYGLPDHRGDTEYARWQQAVAVNDAITKDLALEQESSFGDYVSDLLTLDSSNYQVAIAVTAPKGNAHIQKALKQLGLGERYRSGGRYLLDAGSLSRLKEKNHDYVSFGAAIDYNGAGALDYSKTTQFTYNQKTYSFAKSGVTFLVYDKTLQTVISSAQFNVQSNGFLSGNK